MKKRYVVIGLLAAALSVKGQRADSSYVKKHVKKTDVQVLLSYYTQDNDHSAVTGGTGTEDLQVYASQVSLRVEKDSVRAFHLNAGVDIISSASTDNIDFEMSSASKVDARTHFNVGWDRTYGAQHVGGGAYFSIESDYLSIGGGLSFDRWNEDQSRHWSVAVQTFFDDLRWGRFENGKPQKLVYPEELRYQAWADTYRRNSYNVALGLFQIINRRMALGIYPGVTYQQGLLATPFHRVYFTDDSERVENLPGHRLKLPLGSELSIFTGRFTILKLYYRFYWDDFGILAHTGSVEVPVKVTPRFTLSPFIRLYQQQGADYFKSYGAHGVAERYYTSDYDLSTFSSYKAGMGVRYAPFSKKRRHTFKELDLRYAYYKRSDGLAAHMLTMFFDMGWEKWW